MQTVVLENLHLNVIVNNRLYYEIYMKIFIYITTTFFLISCASIKNANSPDFEKSEIQSGIFLSCNGYKSWQHCYQYAEKACSNGYTVISKDENHLMQARTLRIECKK